MKEQRAKVKGVNLGRLRSIGNLGKTIFNTLLVIIGLFGFREYHRRWYDNEKR